MTGRSNIEQLHAVLPASGNMELRDGTLLLRYAVVTWLC